MLGQTQKEEARKADSCGKASSSNKTRTFPRNSLHFLIHRLCPSTERFRQGVYLQRNDKRFDDVFLHENVIVIAECTVLAEKISEHLKKKKVLYDKIFADPIAFIDFLDSTFPEFSSARGSKYRPEHYRIAIIYCSRNLVDSDLKEEVPGIRYLDFHIAKYFKTITDRIKLSARFELFNFLGLPLSEIGDNVISPSTGSSRAYKGSILPEGQSHFPRGYKVVSF